MLLITIVAAVLIAALWQQVRDLRARVETLEDFQSPPAATWIAPEPVPQAPVVDRAPSPVVEPASAKASWVRPRWAEPEEPEPATLEAEATPVIEAELVPQPEAVSAPAPATEPRPRRAGFEELFGRRLAIWAGGGTLAVSGFLVVRWSIEAGLLAPAVRVILGLLFGALLVGAAEAARHLAERVRDPRVAQSLAGAGVATFYAAILAAANLYELVAPGVAFAGLAATTILAGALSLRFGAPSAVLGLLGGLAAPALVGSDEANVPLLALYLALAVGGLAALGRRQGWWWLGAAALAGGFGWGALLIVGSALDAADTLAVGLYATLLGIGLPLLAAGDRATTLRVGSALLGTAQVAALVATGGFTALNWGLLGLISAALLWLSRREPAATDLPVGALGVTLLLVLAWPHPTPALLSLVLAGLVALHLLPAALRVWRTDTRWSDAPAAAAVALGVGLMPVFHFSDVGLAATSLLGASLAGIVAALGWRCPTRQQDTRFATVAITAAILLAAASAQGLPLVAQPPVLALLTIGLALLATHAADLHVARGGYAFALATLVALGLGDGVWRLFGWEAPGDAADLAQWAVPATVAVLLARLWPASQVATLAQIAGTVLTYGTAAQVLPTAGLAPAASILLGGIAVLRLAGTRPTLVTAAIIVGAWAVEPVFGWLIAGAGSAAGERMVLADWPAPFEALLRLSLPGLALLVAALLPQRDDRLASALPGATLLTMAGHSLFKQVFAISNAGDFADHALAERTLWEAGLAAAAVLAWRLGARRTAVGLGIGSLAHFAWYTLGVLNPLFVAQQPGPWLVGGLAVAGLLLLAAPRALPGLVRQRDWAAMGLSVASTLLLLRQASGPMPLWFGTSVTEQILRSLAALVLAGVFLGVGIRQAARDWRLASLALMVAAVAKVFLWDASGLDGLARIASFAALGFSLIGVGWLYNRFSPDDSR